MRLTAYKHFSIEPIGDISFVFNSKSRRKGKRILISEVHIVAETRLGVNEDDYKALMKLMKEKGSDLLTDGKKFYTTFGDFCIAEIRHPQFEKELELDRELYNKS